MGLGELGLGEMGLGEMGGHPADMPKQNWQNRSSDLRSQQFDPQKRI